MSVFGGNQVGEMIVGATYGDQTDIVDFIENGSTGDVQIFSGDGTAVSEGEFKILQKSASAAGGIEYTEVIDPKNIISLKTSKYVAPVQRQLKVTGFTGTPRANSVYEVFIRIYNDGSLSVENFTIIPVFFQTGETPGTFEDMLNTMKATVDKTLAKRGDNLVTVTVDTGAGELLVEGNNVSFALGKKDGRPVEFDLQAVVRSSDAGLSNGGSFYTDLTVETVEAGNPGSGTGNQVANLEWFLKGNKYDRYRTVGFPNNFDTTYDVDPSKTYNVINIQYFKAREYTNVERQHRYAYIVFQNEDQDGAGAGTNLTAVNAFINDLEVATGQTIGNLA